MDLRHVEQTIKRLLGRPFTGKVIVRIVEGKITRCDVGSPSAPMPYIAPEVAMQDIVNLPEPTPRPPEVAEAEAEAERANAAWQEANDAYFDAEAALRAAERGAWAEASPLGGRVNRHEPSYDAFGVPLSSEVDSARRAVQGARAKKDEAEKALRKARIRAHELGLAWERRRRIGIEAAQAA